MTDINNRIKSASRLAASRRNYRRQRDRALVKLARLHPTTYRELFEEERAKDEAEGKSWVDIDIDTGEPVRGRSARRNSATTNARAEQETDSNL